MTILNIEDSSDDMTCISFVGRVRYFVYKACLFCYAICRGNEYLEWTEIKLVMFVMRMQCLKLKMTSKCNYICMIQF